MCRATDPKARPREINSFNKRDVFRLGDLLKIGGDEWGEIIERVPVRSFS